MLNKFFSSRRSRNRSRSNQTDGSGKSNKTGRGKSKRKTNRKTKKNMTELDRLRSKLDAKRSALEHQKKMMFKKIQLDPDLETAVKTLPKLGEFVKGKDAYGNLEVPTSRREAVKSYIEDLATDERDLFRKIISFVPLRETVACSSVSKPCRLALKDYPLRLDTQSKIIRTGFLENIYKPVLFPDDSSAPHWHVSGIITSVQDLSMFLRVVEPLRLVQFGLSHREIRDVSPLSACVNLEKLEFHHCTKLMDLSPLANLRKLQTFLLINSEHFDDISFIENLESLKSINLANCSKLKDLNPLSSCVNVERLAIQHTPLIEDFSFLKTLKKLEILDLSYHTNLKSLNSFPDTQSFHHLYLSGCESLENIDWLEKHSSNLRLIKFNKCKALKSLNPLKNAKKLLSLTLSENNFITSLGELKNLQKLKFLQVDKCDKITNIGDLVVNLLRLETLFLKSCNLLNEEDAIALMLCDKLYQIDVSDCPPKFLVELLRAPSVVIKKAVKDSIKNRFNDPYSDNNPYAKQIVETLLKSLDSKSKAISEAFGVLQELCLHVKPIASAVINSDFSFNFLMTELKKTGIKEKRVKPKILRVLSAVFNSETHSARKFMSDPNLIKVFTDLITQRTGRSLADEAILPASILSITFANFKKCVYGTRKGLVSPVSVLGAIPKIVRETQNSGVIPEFLKMAKNERKSKDAQTVGYKVLLHFTQLIEIYNGVCRKKAELALEEKLTENADFNLTKIQYPKEMMKDGVLMVLQNFSSMEVEVKMASSAWLIRLLKESDASVIKILHEEENSVLSILHEVFIFAFSAILTREKEPGEQLSVEMITELIRSGESLIKLLPKELMYTFLNQKSIPDGKLETMRVIVHLIEFYNERIGELVKEENQTYASAVPIGSPVSVNKLYYLKHVDCLLSCLHVICDTEDDLGRLLIKSSEKIPGVIASVLHAASDELCLFNKSITLLLKLCSISSQFKAKLQYLYTNSDVTVALKLFIDPPPQSRPRVVKELDQKKEGLQLLSLLLESQSFRIKFLDYSGKEMGVFFQQIKRFIYEIDAISGRQDEEAMRVCGKVIGALVTADKADEKKIKNVVISVIHPMLADLGTMKSPTKIEELEKRERDVIAEEAKGAKPFKDRDPAHNNIFGGILQALTGPLFNARPEPIIDDPDSLGDALFTPEPPQVQRDNFPSPLFNFMNSQRHPDPEPTAEPMSNGLVQQKMVLNWAHRICYFLAYFLAEGRGFGAITLFEEPQLKMICGLIVDAYPSDLPEDQTPGEDMVERINLAQSSALFLLATILNELLTSNKSNLKLRKYLKSDFDLFHSSARNESKEEDEMQQATRVLDRPQPFAGLLGFINPGPQRARDQADQYKKQEQAIVRSVLNKQRQLENVENMSKNLLKIQEEMILGSVPDVHIEEVDEEFDADVQAKLDLIWNVINIYDLSDFADHVAECIESSKLELGCVSAFSLLLKISKMSAKKNINLLEDIASKNGAILEIIKEKLILFEKNGHLILEFILLLNAIDVKLSTELVNSFLESSEGDTEERKLVIAELINKLIVLSPSTRQEITSGDWTIMRTMTNMLVHKSTSTEAKMSILSSFIILLNGDALKVVSLTNASSEKDARLLSGVVSLLLESGETLSALKAEALLLLKSLFTEKEYETEQLERFGEELVNSGVTELTKLWRSDECSNFEQEAALVAVSLIVMAGNADKLEEQKSFIVPHLLNLLISNPTPSLAKTLIVLVPELALSNDAAIKMFSSFETFRSNLENEKRMEKINDEKEDIVMVRLAGLPSEVEFEDKYRFSFKKVVSTIAVQQSKDFDVDKVMEEKSSVVYFELETMQKNSESKAFVGLLPKNVAPSVFGNSLHTLFTNEGKPAENTASYELQTMSHNTVIGVLIDRQKEKVVFSVNGRVSKVVKGLSMLKDSVVPAISGQNVSLQLNFGQVPFKFSPHRRTWKSFQSFARK